MGPTPGGQRPGLPLPALRLPLEPETGGSAHRLGPGIPAPLPQDAQGLTAGHGADRRARAGTAGCDEVEPFDAPDTRAHWITNPAGIVHLLAEHRGRPSD
ncbi:hypothetical protein FNX48_017305 [Streptomyces sp. IF17]|nr:hypothetical protein [Streptomyces alkaliphilus]